MKDIISNCFLCGEKSLHIAGTEEAQVMQCINCGYTTTSKYNAPKETNEHFQKLGEDMKNWAKEENGKIWIPSIITLPIGMLYPLEDDKKMKWGFAPMVEIPEEDRKKYPNPSVPGKFYERKIDTDNPTIYNLFVDALSFVNQMMKNQTK